MGYRFLNLAKEVLEKSRVPLTHSEIWFEGVKYELTEKVGTTVKTPVRSLGARMYMDRLKCM